MSPLYILLHQFWNKYFLKHPFTILEMKNLVLQNNISIFYLAHSTVTWYIKRARVSF